MRLLRLGYTPITARCFFSWPAFIYSSELVRLGTSLRDIAIDKQQSRREWTEIQHNAAQDNS